MNKKTKIFIAGHKGMVGSAVMKNLRKNGYDTIYFSDRNALNLLNQKETEDFFKRNDVDVVIDAAAKVGGIHSNNTYRADFIYENLQIQNNLIHSSYKYGVKKLLFLGSSCIYPKFADQPIKEEYLLTSPLEYTNEPYSVAKIAGIKMCESYHKQYGCDFISIMPTNLYGPGDNFHPDNSHVLPALLRKFHEAFIYNYKKVKVWGTGKAKREFLHVDDLAEACRFVLEKVDSKKVYDQNISHLNVGSGTDISIANLAKLMAKTTKYDGKIEFELDKPDGTLRKLMDNSRIKKLGWTPKISLEKGLKNTYNWYKENEQNIRSF
jgi:GDP-L-fucose synthase